MHAGTESCHHMKLNLNAIKLYQPYIAEYKNHDVIGIDLYGIPLTTIQIFGLLDV